MKNKTNRNLFLIFLCCSIMTAAATAVRAVFLFTAYEPKVGYFKAGFPTIFLSALLLLGILCCVSPFLLLPRGALDTGKCPSRSFLVFSYAVSAAAFFVCGVVILITKATIYDILGMTSGFFCLISAIYFILQIAKLSPKMQQKASVLSPWFCILLIAAQMLLLARSYFDMTVNINGPFTAIYLFSLLSSAVFLLGEMRLEIGIPSPRLHLSAGLTAFFLCCSTAIGNLLLILLGDTGNPSVSDPTGAVLLLATSLFVLTRLLSFRAKTEEN